MTADPFAEDDLGRLYVVTTSGVGGRRYERLVHASSLAQARGGLSPLAQVRRARRSDVERIEGET